jgi:hypothetical protein
MDWKDWQRVLKWRALEEGDADGVDDECDLGM